jgi:stage II sporulation protein D
MQEAPLSHEGHGESATKDTKITMNPPRRTRRSRGSRVTRGLLLVALTTCTFAYLAAPRFVANTPAQTELTDEDLVNASGGRVVGIGAVSGGGQISRIPLELYVARVLAGEGEPNAADAARHALAIAVRTYTIVQMGRHRRDGFDLCDTVHCQVLRAANEGSRRAALSTAGRVLTIDGAPAEVYYSASCGGRTEGAAQVWPGATFPYMQVVRDDDVHAEDVPWTLGVTLAELRETLARAGFGGAALRDIEIDGHTPSGRVERLRLPGLRPDAIAATAFRDALGTTRFRSTAFSLVRDSNTIRFTGRGYGHGVGMCVVGAGRRARRGESVEAILAQYYPNLAITSLGNVTAQTASAPPTGVDPARARRITTIVPRGSTVSGDELERLAGRAYESLSRALGATAASVTVELHDTLDGFRLEARQPWWVSAAVTGTTIDLAPVALLAQRDGLEITLRTAMAELLMSGSLAGRPAWVRVGGARYFSSPPPAATPSSDVTCPADAELTLAVSAVSQREAESRAVKCFSRAVARAGDWRLVR